MRLNRWVVLSQEDLQYIHQASLSILAETGVQIASRKVLKLLENNGADVDYSLERARVPGSLVEDCLKSLPAQVMLCNRNGEPGIVLGSGRTFSASGHNAIYLLNPDSRERVPATKKTVGEFALISDALENIHVVGVQAMPQDVSPKASLLHAMDAVFNNCTKHVFFSPESEIVTAAILHMMQAVAGADDLSTRTVATCQLSPTSPLFWERGAVEALMLVAESGVPCCLLPQPFSGVTSPYTLAGTLTVHNAEVLSGIVISQLVRRGAPVIYGSAWTTFDMREGNVQIGRPEAALMRIAGVQLAQFYHIPSHTIGPDSDAHCHDEQNGFEKLLSAVSALSAGVDLLVNSGMFDTGLSVSFEQLIIDEEILGLLYRLCKGIEVAKDTVGLDTIKKVGPRGDFLVEEHTFAYLRRGEHWIPTILNACRYEKWMSEGAPSLVERAREKAKKILAEHRCEPLRPDVQCEVTRIIHDFEIRAMEQ